MTAPTAVLAGVGGYVPPTVEANEQLARVLDTTDEWIRTRTGISQRHIVDAGMRTSDLAVEAGRQAQRSAARTGVDLVIVATATPDRACPATAPEVASRLGLGQVPAFDLAAVCSGFVYAVTVTDAFIRSGQASAVLVIGADTFTTLIDPSDRGTRPIFGDGAGAVVLRAGSPMEPGAIAAAEIHSDGLLVELIATGARPSRGPAGAVPEPYLRMQGRSTYINAIRRMEEVSASVLARLGWAPSDVDAVVGHQANARILESLVDKLQVRRDAAIVNIAHVGNTSAASIPLALVYGAVTRRLSLGDRVLMPAFGAGATWGAVALTWPSLAAEPYDDRALYTDNVTATATAAAG